MLIVTLAVIITLGSGIVAYLCVADVKAPEQCEDAKMHLTRCAEE